MLRVLSDHFLKTETGAVGADKQSIKGHKYGTACGISCYRRQVGGSIMLLCCYLMPFRGF